MSKIADRDLCSQMELVGAYALRALPAQENSDMQAHIAVCEQCRAELKSLDPILNSFSAWPTEILRPPPSLWDQLISQITDEVWSEPIIERSWVEPDWEEVAPGISCKLLATNGEKDRVTMLVRLAPRTEYPPHTHAGVEELLLLNGELWIDDRKLYPGDYNRAEPGTSDELVWSETGCTCLLITSPSDALHA